MLLKHSAGETINDRKFGHMKDTNLPERSVSRFKSCVPGGSSCASLSNGRLHYEIVCKDCITWI
jgi:hypothetical protein